jgi:hypothetical protein
MHYLGSTVSQFMSGNSGASALLDLRLLALVVIVWYVFRAR